MDLDTSSRKRITFLSLGVMLLIWGVGSGLDLILTSEGVTRARVLLVSDGLTAIVAGLLFYYYTMSNNERERNRMLQERLRTISEMNHHIRNALLVINFEASSEKYERSVERIRDSVARIEWALREVLPQYAPPPNPGEEHLESHGK